MTQANKRTKQARTLRIFRKIHRITGAALFIFFFFISVTGFLLGWKKHSNGVLMPETYVGTSTDLKKWLPIDSLHTKAVLVLRDSVSPNISTEIDRIDIRKEKGSVKFVFTDHFWGIQLDGATGDVLHVDKRYSDFIENIHDGSILVTGGTTAVLSEPYTGQASAERLLMPIQTVSPRDATGRAEP